VWKFIYGLCGMSNNKFILSIENARYQKDSKPLDPGCICYTCQNFSRAYLRTYLRLIRILYHQLATIHSERLVFKVIGWMLGLVILRLRLVKVRVILKDSYNKAHKTNKYRTNTGNKDQIQIK